MIRRRKIRGKRSVHTLCDRPDNDKNYSDGKIPDFDLPPAKRQKTCDDAIKNGGHVCFVNPDLVEVSQDGGAYGSSIIMSGSEKQDLRSMSNKKQSFGPEINKYLAHSVQDLLEHGMDPVVQKAKCDAILPPKNCTRRSKESMMEYLLNWVKRLRPMMFYCRKFKDQLLKG